MLFWFWLVRALPFLLVISKGMNIFGATYDIALSGGFDILFGVILHIPLLGENDCLL